ncbi:MAG: hypothetical protein ACREOV_06830, partial [Candidatus Dormibacteraceae bacterium]
GLYPPKAEQLPRVVGELLDRDAEELRRMTRRAAGVIRPGASAEIVDTCMQVVREARAAAPA